jgi:DNA polymerase-3 subunit delta'
MSEHGTKDVFHQRAIYPWFNGLWDKIYARPIQADLLAHALLLTGVEHVGKTNLAFFLGKSLLCHSPKKNSRTGLLEACHHCRSCQLFEAGNHPDIYHLTVPDEKKIIPVDAVRELIQWSVLSSQLQGRKVVILEPAEAMNINAANSLLKTLEEPVQDLILILVSSHKQSLLPTIRSRCQIIDIKLPEPAQVTAWLNQQQVQQPELMLSLASGAPLLALALAQGTQLELRRCIVEQLLAIVRDGQDPVAAADMLFKLTKPNKKAPGVSSHDILYWLHHFVSDVIRVMQKCSTDHISSLDYELEIQQISSRINLKKVLQLIERMAKLFKEVKSSMNVNLLIENIMIDWQNCKT